MQYAVYIRHIHVTNRVDNYKIYLVMLWIITECMCKRGGINIDGYTEAQIHL